eukprot:m.497046 g.497046  ORF g.497046 m.497046 type:complete len:305 (+) comp57310_c0_seq3:140-1054(+)
MESTNADVQAQLDSVRAESSRQLNDLTEIFRQNTEQSKEREAKVKALEQQLDDKAGACASLQQQLSAEQQQRSAESDELRQQLRVATESHKDCEVALSERDSAIHTAESKAESLAASVATSETEIAALKAQLDSLTEDLAQSRRSSLGVPDSRKASRASLAVPGDDFRDDESMLSFTGSEIESEPVSPAKLMQLPKGRDEVDSVVLSILDSLQVSRTVFRHISKGKYVFEPENKTLLMKVMKSNVLVRVGGGWQDLREYLRHHKKFKSLHETAPPLLSDASVSAIDVQRAVEASRRASASTKST